MHNRQIIDAGQTYPFIYRPRCMDLMQQEAHRPLLVLVAPMGYGKTTLLEAWAESLRSSGVVSWLTLDQDDNQPRQWLSRFILALPHIDEEHRMKMIEQVKKVDGAGMSMPWTAVLDELIQSFPKQIGVHLFFDRYEAIQSVAAHHLFEYFITHSGKNIHFYIASREKPPFYRSIRSLHPAPLMISQEHLKMNVAEIQQFIRHRTKRQLHHFELQRLDQLTEGWPLAVEMFVSLLDGKRAEPLNEHAAMDAIGIKLQELFLDEVLLKQPEERQQFMLRTSIPAFFDAELSLLLTSDPSYHIHIDQLKLKSLFLFQEQDGRYRYHTLFAQFLRRRFKQLDKTEYVSLHEKISLWSENKGYMLDAAQHALYIPDYDRASSLLLEDIDSTIACPRQSLISLLEQFPGTEISKRPSIAMFYAWLLITENRIAAAETVLDSAEAQMVEESYIFTPTGENLRGYIASIRSRIYLLRRDTERGIALMHETAMLLNGPGYLYRHANTLDPCGNSLLNSNVGYWGAIDQAVAVYGYAEPLWEGINQGYGIIHATLGECYYERNQLTRAEKSLTNGRRIGLDLLETGIILPATITLARLRWNCGEQQAALILLEETRKLFNREELAGGIAVIDACETRLQIKANQPQLVRKWLRNQRTDTDGVLDMQYLYEYLTLLRVYVFLGHYRQGIAFGEKLLQFSQSWYLHYYVAEINLLLAILYERNGVKRAAYHKLENALDMGQKEGYIQLFLEEWATAERLLHKFGKQMEAKHSTCSQEIRTFYTQLVQYNYEKELIADRDYFAQKKLTAKEYKVLQGLIAKKSNADIAALQSIRIETVKTHCKNIYKKLGLKSRKDVVRFFEEIDGEFS